MFSKLGLFSGNPSLVWILLWVLSKVESFQSIARLPHWNTEYAKIRNLLSEQFLPRINGSALQMNADSFHRKETKIWKHFCCLNFTFNARLKVSESMLAMCVAERPPYCTVLKQRDQIWTLKIQRLYSYLILYWALLSSVSDIWHWTFASWDTKAYLLDV